MDDTAEESQVAYFLAKQLKYFHVEYFFFVLNFVFM